jgi:hypothetical protein
MILDMQQHFIRMMMVYFYLNGGKITVPDGFVINYNKQSNHPDIIDS